MTLPVFLDELSRSSLARQRRFHDEARSRMFKALWSRSPSTRAEDAEDAISETLEDLAAGRIRGFVCAAPPGDPAFAQALAGFLAWQIAPRKLVDIYRRTKREHLIGDMSNPEAATDESLFERLLGDAFAPSAEDIVSAEQPLLLLRRCVEALPGDKRAVVRLLMEELRQAEIATRLGIPVGTVKSRLFSAMALLARCMGVADTEGSVS